MKLIVTGHDHAGRSVFAFAGPAPREIHPGSHTLWATRGEIRVPDPTEADAPPPVAYFPIEGESSFKIVTVPGRDAALAPTAGGMPSTGDEAGVAGAASVDVADVFDAEDPAMHTTDTLDYVIVLSGRAELELDGGRREAVAAGDCIVQRGTRHAWRVTSDEPLVLGAVLLGARRVAP